MAAKQGTLAQLSASAEDAKRAVLCKAGVNNSSWFSNLNTVCTIKSAPPRSPEVLQMLSTKSGWLYKRNEQHVWQARWCCVVPHMFLYYFDGPAVVGTRKISNPTASQQENWNHAVLEGLGNRKPHEKRSHFPFIHGGGDPSQPSVASSDIEADDVKSGVQNSQPAGIIDLECYTSLHRSSENPKVLQMAGDDQVNPDLRSFYFCCEKSSEVEEWNAALLNGRHSALTDEVDAYRQVADGFAQQLQMLHSELDEITTQQEESEQELYRVRSAAEETRRAVYRVVEECWERPIKLSNKKMDLHERRTEAKLNMETIRQQDMGVGAAVRLFADYVGDTEDLVASLQQTVQQLQNDVKQTGQTDQAEIEELQQHTRAVEARHQAEKEQLIKQLEAAQAASQASAKELADVQKDLSSTKMEVTMLMSQQRNKLATQQQHKKILKKEVIDLRQKLDDTVSEQSSLQHEFEKMKLQLEQERSKSKLLSRYVDKMESQVTVQQNMMEMMSQAGGSVYGGGSVYAGPRSVVGRSPDNDFTPNRRNRSSMEEDEDLDDFENEDDRILLQPPNVGLGSSPRKSRRRTPRMGSLFPDNDDKSHVSELTEDRTQREFAAFQNSQMYSQMYHDPEPSRSPNRREIQARRNKRAQEQRLANSMAGPPSVIIGVKKSEKSESHESSEDEDINGDERLTRTLDTIDNNESVRSMPTITGRPSSASKRKIPRGKADASTASTEQTTDTEKKLSVAERARLEADRKTTPVRARLDDKSLSSLTKNNSSRNLLTSATLSPPRDTQSSPNKSSRRKNGLWKRMENVVLGPASDDESDTSTSSNRDGTSSSGTDEKAMSTRRGSENSDEKKSDSVSVSTRMSLQERSRLQRENKLRFLREQGLIKNETDVGGGSGSVDNVSVTSSMASPERRFSPGKSLFGQSKLLKSPNSR